MMMMMASFTSKILLLFIISMTVQEGCGLPAAERPEQPAQTPPPVHIRTKRCSCNNWQDNECFYFCHLDVIWVNTPSKILPYGLGNPLSRRRRSAGRCECLNPADKSCHGFCRQSSEDSRRDVMGSLAESTNNNKLLAFLRSVVKSNTVTANHIQPFRRRAEDV
ncbi:endothelin-2 [Cololabis saira]|uniref:endothelin-2 n=1 Tax=Cololabis saira TaxID=129043 RepID=UPI002AD2CFE6|nr:endothelin-2 [Cololabis saira]